MKLFKPLALLTGLFIVACFTGSFTLTENKRVTNVGEKAPVSVGPEIQVGKDGASTVFAYYNTTPESPDGKSIFHLRYKIETIDDKALLPAELWICDRDLKNYRLIAEIEGAETHNGVKAVWVDNNHIALQDNFIIRVVDIRNGKDILKQKIETDNISHNAFQGKIMYGPTKNKGNQAPGIYELNCFTGEVRVVILMSDCVNTPLPSYLDKTKVGPVETWRAGHLQYSPDGKRVAFKFDVGKADVAQLLGICSRDGSDFVVQPKSLHFLWYDNASIVGHLRYDEHGDNPQPGERFYLTRWDLVGKPIETIAAYRGNHLAVSPDLKYFVDETFYQTNPVIMYLIGKDQKNRIAEIDRFDPYDVVWKRKFHANPAFSRDGKRIYYSKPLNEKYSGTFYREINYER
ncbi:MAG: hypothetical protein AAGU19_01380 [Prolixibacteraceae bacterium]